MPDEINQTFGEWLKGKRQELGITQCEAATRAGINGKHPEQQWSKYENDIIRPRLGMVVLLAEAVGVDRNKALQMAGYRENTPSPSAKVSPIHFQAIMETEKPNSKMLDFLRSMEETAGFSFSKELCIKLATEYQNHNENLC